MIIITESVNSSYKFKGANGWDLNDHYGGDPLTNLEVCCRAQGHIGWQSPPNAIYHHLSLQSPAAGSPRAGRAWPLLLLLSAIAARW